MVARENIQGHAEQGQHGTGHEAVPAVKISGQPKDETQNRQDAGRKNGDIEPRQHLCMQEDGDKAGGGQQQEKTENYSGAF
ncbi:hypothetical protein RUMHYD_00658 [Blautia hydrogenotrophica DSM 10507]|uniref:Uncharacterized protein n=1 Tax=Blautia hydrogenotrophica (strain DSM 10507 / JCM 14656 / S5a33) TaxID=476272 RepID=C0CIJ5_BLAHS|nr:hypothetical protein RUMHYD_00658 [Blautia hydrogenotrophica DSM 10507]